LKGDTAIDLIPDEKKANRHARVFMNDIGAYYPEIVEMGSSSTPSLIFFTFILKKPLLNLIHG
jgi:hypothetical protein